MKNISLESLNTSLSQKIENLIDSGFSGQEAITESLSSISDDLTNLGLSEDFISSIKTTSSSIFEQSLTDGLTVNEAINIVLKNIKETQAFSELNGTKNIEKKTVENKEKNQENTELNIIEADMDAQELNNIAEINYDENISSENLDQVNEQEKLEEPNKDDEIS